MSDAVASGGTMSGTKAKATMTISYRAFGHAMSQWYLVGTLLLAIGIPTSPRSLGQPPGKAKGIDAMQVKQSIDKAVQYLVRQQQKDGNWSGHVSYGSGQSALVTLALLSSGLSPKHKTVERALTYLRSRTPDSTYEVSLQTMVYCMAEPMRDMPLIQRNVAWLVEQQNARGGWGYGNIARGFDDESNSQFALLALWEASRLGIEIPDPVFQKASAYWMANRMQTRNGPAAQVAWRYDGGPETGSMTCAGIASLLISDDALQFADARIVNDRIQCCGGEEGATVIDAALGWLASNFSVSANPGGSFWLYYMYALERVGRLTGQRFVGKHDWYREGAQQLLEAQDTTSGFFVEGSDNVTATALALLFLSKGKRQVVLGLLDYTASDEPSKAWKEHRRAIQHLTGHVEQVWKRDLSWQSVTLKQAKIADLLETPVLFISGSKRVGWSAAHKKLLKDFVQQGGFLFAEACDADGCQGAEFDAEFRALVVELFDQPLKKLPPTHPIWFAESRVDPKALPEGFWLYGVEACCKTSVVYSPISLSCRWELARPFGTRPRIAPSVQADLDNAVKIGLNVASYATGRELKDKLDRVDIVQVQSEGAKYRRGTLFLPKLLHGGGADDAPRAVPTLVELFKREVQSDASSRAILLNPSDPELAKHYMAYIHGRHAFRFADDQRQAMRRFFENGGFLIGDSICASPDFSDSFRTEMAAILPDASLVAVPPEHPIIAPSPYYANLDIRRVTLLDPVPNEGDAEGLAKIQRRQGPPVLEMLVWQKRPVAIFSPYDLSCALESRGATQCRGYSRADAARIGMNMILYALNAD
jgi:hypothetical protein